MKNLVINLFLLKLLLKRPILKLYSNLIRMLLVQLIMDVVTKQVLRLLRPVVLVVLDLITQSLV